MKNMHTRGAIAALLVMVAPMAHAYSISVSFDDFGRMSSSVEKTKRALSWDENLRDIGRRPAIKRKPTTRVAAAPKAQFAAQTSIAVKGGFVTDETPETEPEPALLENRELDELTQQYAEDVFEMAKLPAGTTYVATIEISSEGEAAEGKLMSLNQSLQLVAVPLPATLPLAAFGVGLLGLVARRRG